MMKLLEPLNKLFDIVDKVVPDANIANKLKLQIKEVEKEIAIKQLEVEAKEVPMKVKLLERLPIPAMLYTFLLVIINNNIIAPYVQLFFKIQIPILQIDDRLYTLIQTIVVAVLGKKSLDKIVTK